MTAPGFEYVALRTIVTNDVRAFNAGDLVPAGAVRSKDNPDGWLTVGEDVVAREEWAQSAEVAPEDPERVAAVVAADAARPPRKASKADWVAFAAEYGDMTAEDAEKLTRDDLAAQFSPPAGDTSDGP